MNSCRVRNQKLKARCFILFLLCGLVFLSAMAVSAATPKVGTFTKWNGIDFIEIKQLFLLSDYSAIQMVALDIKAVELPEKDDNTYEPVVNALAAVDEVLLGAMKENLETVRIERAEAVTQSTAAPAASSPKALVIRGQVTKMNPGSAAARMWAGGMLGGPGGSRVEIRCEVADAQTGQVLLTMKQASYKTGGGGIGGLSYDKLLRNNTKAIGKDLAKLLLRFK